MPVLLLVLALLATVAVGISWFLRANPSNVARALRPALLVLSILVFLVVAGEFATGLLPELFALAGIAVAVLVIRSMRRPRAGFSTPGGAQRTEVTTRWLRAWIDHATSDVGATVLAGRFVGRTLESLGESDLLQLHDECAGDADSLRVLEAYLDRRLGAGWRRGSRTPQGPRGDMTRSEAFSVLGLADGASEEEIRAAHRRLIQRVHPDVGGSADLAARINRAKSVLLGQ